MRKARKIIKPPDDKEMPQPGLLNSISNLDSDIKLIEDTVDSIYNLIICEETEGRAVLPIATTLSQVVNNKRIILNAISGKLQTILEEIKR